MQDQDYRRLEGKCRSQCECHPRRGDSFSSVDVKINDFQTLLVDVLTESADDAAACEIRVQEPETRKDRTYGWDGYSPLR
ncbi:MAG: hypothetical protein KDA96_25400 [Planctomycetaceae bacterium]|nr:hypothetical protein [Planctomycetaceae bacterium]